MGLEISTKWDAGAVIGGLTSYTTVLILEAPDSNGKAYYTTSVIKTVWGKKTQKSKNRQEHQRGKRGSKTDWYI